MKVDATVILFTRGDGTRAETWWAGREEYDRAVASGYLEERQYDPPRPLYYDRIAFARVEEIGPRRRYGSFRKTRHDNRENPWL